MRDGAIEALAALRVAYDAFATCDFEGLTRPELIAVMDEYESLTCRLPSQTHRLLAQLQAEATPREMGAKSWNAVLRIRWRLSTGEAGRRLAEAADLPTQAQIDNDHRTLAQCQHDAMLVVGRIALMSGDRGQFNGLPVSGWRCRSASRDRRRQPRRPTLPPRWTAGPGRAPPARSPDWGRA
ncbi:MAG: DUF222 domain-containing protein [Mycolicibacterium cosmeticum]|nr:DUF222 domain-containing protein [Mycolicibacterium cosmeticum]